MGLISKMFRGDPDLEACLLKDGAHITLDSFGVGVMRIQVALLWLDQATDLGPENDIAVYGPRTAAAVLAYKTKRAIINFAYEDQADSIVGKMTIARMDAELAEYETHRDVRATVRRRRRGGLPVTHALKVF